MATHRQQQAVVAIGIMCTCMVVGQDSVSYSVPIPNAPVGQNVPYSNAAALAHLQTTHAMASAGYNVQSQYGLNSMDPRMAGWGPQASSAQYAAYQAHQGVLPGYPGSGFPYGTSQSFAGTQYSQQSAGMPGFRSKRGDGFGQDTSSMRFASHRGQASLGTHASSSAKAGAGSKASAQSASAADAALKQAEEVLRQAQKVSLMNPQTGEGKAATAWHSAYRPAQMRLMGPSAIEAWKAEHARFVSERRSADDGTAEGSQSGKGKSKSSPHS